MKVILKADAKNLGKKGELVNTSDGYARNYLFQRGLPLRQNATAMNDFNNKESAKKFHKEEEIKAAKADAAKLEGKMVKVTAKAGANGKLFGSVTGKDISAAIKQQLGIEVDKRKKSPLPILSSSAHLKPKLRFIRESVQRFPFRFRKHNL